MHDDLRHRVQGAVIDVQSIGTGAHAVRALLCHAVGGGENPIRRDDATTADVIAVDLYAHLMRYLLDRRDLTAHDVPGRSHWAYGRGQAHRTS